MTATPDGGARAEGDVSWTVVASDSFDRESPPSTEAKGQGLAAGLEVLWKKYLAQGILDSGQPTFTDFQLRFSDGDRTQTAEVSVKVPDDQVRPGAVKLLQWSATSTGLLAEVAAAHARLVRRRDPRKARSGLEESTALLKLAAQSPDEKALRRALSQLK